MKAPIEIQALVFKRISYFFASVIVIFAFCIVFVYAKPEYNPVVRYYTSSGIINQPTRVWDGVITPTTGAGQTVDISSAGFSSINSVSITPANNTSTVTSMPFVCIKSYTTSQITVNVLTSNNQTISILGANVTPVVTATTLTGMSFHVHVDGW